MDSPQRRLEEIFTHFPGIGPRQAKRFIYHLISRSPKAIKEFVDLVTEVKKSTTECLTCHRYFFTKDITASTPTVCAICKDTSRDATTIVVVSRDSDFEAIEKSGAYKGLYFVLGGVVPILDKDPEKRIRLQALLERLSMEVNLSEIILSLNTTPEGEHTTTIVKDAISHIYASKEHKPKITILGRGLSTGAELEYADGETIKNAIRNRG